MTTVQQIVEAAYARSTSNDPGKLAGDAELIAYINRRYQLRFALLAAAAGDNMLAQLALNFAGSPPAVALPSDVIDLIRVQNAAGGKVHIIPVDEKDRGWHQAPAIYRQGLLLISRNTIAGDPGPGYVATLFYLDAPAALTLLASALDARYPVRWELLLINETALYLSTKDEGRDEGEYKELASEVARDEAAFNIIVYGSATAKERPVAAQTAGKQ